jgi:hypothetical protein
MLYRATAFGRKMPSPIQKMGTHITRRKFNGSSHVSATFDDPITLTTSQKYVMNVTENSKMKAKPRQFRER